MRSAILLSVLLFFPLLGGCLTEMEDAPPQIEGAEPEPEQKPEPWTRRLFLFFPDPCPEDAVGNTTYSTRMETTNSRACGKGIADATTKSPPCAVFLIHDPEYRLYKSQRVAANIHMEYGPGPVEVQFIWMDDGGIIAEGASAEGVASTGHISIGRGPGYVDANANVQRNSTAGLRFEIHAENFSCGKISVGGNNGNPASAIWVEED